MSLNGAVTLRSMTDTPHEFPFIRDNKTLTWERLEKKRLEKLGLNNRYSRHFNVRRENTIMKKSERGAGIPCVSSPRDTQLNKKVNGKDVVNKPNSIAPFATVGKATCGYFFSDQTSNKKKNFGIPPTNLVKWRNFPPTNSS